MRIPFSAEFLVACLLAFASAIRGYAQCVTCHDLSTSSVGWGTSPDPALCGPQCSNLKDKACQENCNPALDATATFDNSLNPRLLVEQHGGKLLVKAVIPGSPAAKADIRRGDEISSVNGIVPGRSCKLTTWASRESNISALTLRRNGVKTTVELILVPIYQLARALWTGVSPNTSLASEYSLGFTWEAGSGYLQITGLLVGSAAAKSGLVVGDRIVFINSRPALNDDSLNKIRPSESHYGVRLDVIRNGKAKTVTVQSTSLLDVLSTVSESDVLKAAQLPVLAAFR